MQHHPLQQRWHHHHHHPHGTHDDGNTKNEISNNNKKKKQRRRKSWHVYGCYDGWSRIVCRNMILAFFGSVVDSLFRVVQHEAFLPAMFLVVYASLLYQQHQLAHQLSSLQPPQENQTTAAAMANGGAQQQQQPQMVVFYHIFLPEKPTRYRRALRMVEEQLQQISAAQSSRITTVYYTTVGGLLEGTTELRQHGLHPAYMNYLCQTRLHLNCIHLGHYPEQAYEEVTLTRLYQHCQQQQATTSSASRVMYVHSKGTYHQTPENNQWRRHLTAAATSSSCLEALTATTPATCNVCGLQFYPLWDFFFPGNMWTASCEYVNQLLPPVAFMHRMDEVVHELSRHMQQPSSLEENAKNAKQADLAATLFDYDNPSIAGTGRYASEHWIASHPHVRPCDLSTTTDISFWRQDQQQQQQSGQQHLDHYDNIKLSHAPRYGLLEAPWYRLDPQPLQRLLQDPNQRKKEVFFLPGLLQKWNLLYGPQAVPPADSWIWNWFPDGSYWRNRVHPTKGGG